MAKAAAVIAASSNVLPEDRLAGDLETIQIETHPSVSWQFRRLAEALSIMPTNTEKGKAWFRAFEVARSADKQVAMQAAGRSKASPYESGHQLGLAVDFVPWTPEEGFHWPPADHESWNLLRREAGRVGLQNSIAWDRAHVEHQKKLKAVRKAYGAA